MWRVTWYDADGRHARDYALYFSAILKVNALVIDASNLDVKIRKIQPRNRRIN